MSILDELQKLVASFYKFCGSHVLSIRCDPRLVNSLLFLKLIFVYQLFIYLEYINMSFPRRRESSKAYKNLFLYAYYINHAFFTLMFRIFFMDSRLRGNDIEEGWNDAIPRRFPC